MSLKPLDELGSTLRAPKARTLSLTDKMREIARHVPDDFWHNELLSLAGQVATLEGNLTHLANITVASADEAAELKSASKYRIERHRSILETVGKMLLGIPAWRFPAARDEVTKRAARTATRLDARIAGKQ